MTQTLLRARVRTTTSTERRIENMRRLIAELVSREMMADEMSFFLTFSPSGTRKYIRDLRDAGVIELARYAEGTATYLGKAVYCITTNAELLAKFMDSINTPSGRPFRPGAPTNLTRAQRDPSRHIHLLNDDVPFMPRLERDRPAQRDPLVAFLFGDAGKVA